MSTRLGQVDLSLSPAEDKDRLRILCGLPVPNIGDAVDRLMVLDNEIKPMWPEAHLLGKAFTVLTRPGDNKGIHDALGLVEPGDILVVAGGAERNRALMGELIAARAASLQLGGFLIDGAVRDVDGMKSYGIPVFARSVSAAGPYRTGPYRLRVPVSMGGVVVQQSDVVVGDENGVVVVPAADVQEIASRAHARHQKEEERRAILEHDIHVAHASQRHEGSI